MHYAQPYQSLLKILYLYTLSTTAQYNVCLFFSDQTKTGVSNAGVSVTDDMPTCFYLLKNANV